MALNDWLSSPWIIGVLVSIVLVGGLFFYVQHKLAQQDHKLSTMVGLVSSVAGEMEFWKQQQRASGAGGSPPPHVRQMSIFQPSLIPVSEDEREDDDEEEDDDDEDFDDDEDDDDDDGGDNEESSDDDDFEPENLEPHVQVWTVHLGNPIPIEHDIEELKSNLSDDDDSEDDKTVVTKSAEEGAEAATEEERKEEAKDDLRTINITSLDFPVDYKKMSLPKLRSLAGEKGVADASKMKKQELLKHLGVE